MRTLNLQLSCSRNFGEIKKFFNGKRYFEQKNSNKYAALLAAFNLQLNWSQYRRRRGEKMLSTKIKIN